jgi:hypothetical protein
VPKATERSAAKKSLLNQVETGPVHRQAWHARANQWPQITRPLPPRNLIEAKRCLTREGAMTTKEAFDIVLSLASINMVDETEMPELYQQQSEALDIVAEIAKYYGSKRK